MPNWCSGSITIRGTFKNIGLFLKYGLIDASNKNYSVRINNRNKTYYVENMDFIYIDETSRTFISNIDISPVLKPQIYFKDIYSLILGIDGAWDIAADELTYVSGKFDLYLEVDAEEPGNQFTRYIEIDNGDIVYNLSEDMEDEEEYDDE